MKGSNMKDLLPLIVPDYSGIVLFYDEKLSKTENLYYFEPGLYASIAGNAETMNSLIQNRNNHSDTCIRVPVFQKTRRSDVSFLHEESGFMISSLDSRPFFGSGVGIYMGFLLRGKRPHKLLFAYDIVWLRSLKVNRYTPTLSGTVQLETQKLPCWVVFLSHQNWSPAIPILPDNAWTSDIQNTAVL